MRRSICVLVSAWIMVGCSTTATFYPIEGPISAAKPVQTLKAKVNGIMGNSGSMVLTWNDGTLCEGQWSVAAGQQVAVGNSSLISKYGSAYGSQIMVGNTGGQNQGRAFLICPDGNTLDAEFVIGSGTANGFGFAKDKSGNVFRVLF